MNDFLTLAPSTKSDIEALEDLVLDNDLDRLEGRHHPILSST